MAKLKSKKRKNSFLWGRKFGKIDFWCIYFLVRYFDFLLYSTFTHFTKQIWILKRVSETKPNIQSKLKETRKNETTLTFVYRAWTRTDHTGRQKNVFYTYNLFSNLWSVSHLNEHFLSSHTKLDNNWTQEYLWTWMYANESNKQNR